MKKLAYMTSLCLLTILSINTSKGAEINLDTNPNRPITKGQDNNRPNIQVRRRQQSPFWRLIDNNPLPPRNTYQGKQGILFWGPIGHGKSTSAHYLAGSSFVRGERASLQPQHDNIRQFIKEDALGDTTRMFCTVPYYHPRDKQSWDYIDFPGFGETGNEAQPILNAFAFRLCITHLASVRAILCVFELPKNDYNSVAPHFRSFLEDFHGLFKEKITLDEKGAQLITLQEGYEPNIFCILTKYQGSVEETEDNFAQILQKLRRKTRSSKHKSIISIFLQRKHILCLDPTDKGQSRQRMVAILKSIRQEELLKAAHFNMTIPPKIKSSDPDQPDIPLQEAINKYKAEFMALSGAIYDQMHKERQSLIDKKQWLTMWWWLEVIFAWLMVPIFFAIRTYCAISTIQQQINRLGKKLLLHPQEAQAVWNKVLKAFTDKYPKNPKNINRFRVFDTVQNFTIKEITANAQNNPKTTFQTTLLYELADHYA